MRPLRYSINVMLDGCVNHEAAVPDEELHRYFAEGLARADALIFGRVTYQMMQDAWRKPADGVWPGWMADWMIPFAESIDRARKYVVSSTLESLSWNSELLRGDLANEVKKLKEQPGNGLAVGGVTLPLALADLGLIDEYEFVVHPVVAGYGPYLMAGLTKRLELTLVDSQEFKCGAVAHRYVPAS